MYKTKIMKKCPKCQIEKEDSEFYKNSKRKDGLRAYCKSCELKMNANKDSKYRETRKQYRQSTYYKNLKKKYYENNKSKILSENLNWRNSLIGKLNSYIRSANKRNIQWELTEEEFSTFWQKPCYYCNEPIQTIGLDRVNNQLPYTISNVVSCCSICNTMKMAQTENEFFNKIKQIYEIHRNRGGFD